MTFGQMITDLTKKFGSSEAPEVLKLRLMWLSFKSPNGKVTFQDIEKYYKKIVDKYNNHML